MLTANTRSSLRSLARFAALACAGVLLSLLAGTMGPAGAEDDAQPAGSVRLDSRLAEIVDALREQGIQAAGDAARRLDVDIEGDAVRVVIEAQSGPTDSTNAARGLGAKIEGTYQDLVQVLVPVASLEALASAGPVKFVRPPLRALPMVTGEGVALINADDWHALGISGAGVKAAILDLGFQGYESLLGTELPATVTAMSFRADGDITGAGQPHGTAVAEIVHEVAPGAELYLANFDTEVELASASAWLTSQGVEVINASWGYFVSGPGDGTGVVNNVVTTSTAAGTLWSVAAANHAQRHWSGPFLDTDGDLWHEFQNTPAQDEGNQITGAFFGLAFPGEVIGAELKWDDPFDAACRDYNLYLKRTDDTGAPITVASSENIQNDGTACVPGADPIESLIHTVTVADIYHIVIQKSVANSDAFLHLYSFFHDIEYVVSANSLGQPADNPGALAVGAVYWNTPNSIESFSSRGPTSDGRIKPDLSAPDGVSSATYGSFFGTSAAAPHITGAAALVRQRLPCYTPAQLRAYLEGSAVDLGAAGKDTTYGSGRLVLGAAPPDTDADATGDACDPDDDNDGWTDVAEGFITTDPLIACLSAGWPPDEDSSGTVEISDVFFAASRYGAGAGDAGYTPRAEVASQNGVLGIDDVFAFSSRFGHTCPPS